MEVPKTRHVVCLTQTVMVADDSVLARERARATFDPAELTNLLYGGAASVSRQRELSALIEKDAVFDKSALPFLNHSQLYESALARGKHFAQLMRKHGLSAADQQTCYQAVDAVLPFDVHRSMFVPTLANQTTPVQREKWLPLAQDFRILGAYAQTELGHGSNVRAIETTATYDAATQEFEIHSPTLTSTKWWPGGLGLTATRMLQRFTLARTQQSPNLSTGAWIPVRQTRLCTRGCWSAVSTAASMASSCR